MEPYPDRNADGACIFLLVWVIISIALMALLISQCGLWRGIFYWFGAQLALAILGRLARLIYHSWPARETHHDHEHELRRDP